MGRKAWWTILVLPLFLGCLPPGPPSVPPPSDGYLFCFWNVENLFDDQLDNYGRTPDKEYDAWYAKNPDVLNQKLANLSSLLMQLNDKRGPDILCVAEVEGERAARLLKDALNDRIKDPNLMYRSVLCKDLDAGRHICTAVITRLPTDGSVLLDKRRRILEGYVIADGVPLVLLPSHWTSRVSDDEGNGRQKYADIIYSRFLEMYQANRAIDFLTCGDFNDTPEDASVVKNLHARGDPKLVLEGSKFPYLFDPLMGKDPNTFGTHYYRGKFYIFDQIAVSPGMLDAKGWRCDPESVTVVKASVDKKGRPIEFGSATDKVPLTERGWSDHLPVTMRLKVTR